LESLLLTHWTGKRKRGEAYLLARKIGSPIDRYLYKYAALGDFFDSVSSQEREDANKEKETQGLNRMDM